MHMVTHTITNKKGEFIKEVFVAQADSIDDAVSLAGSIGGVVTLFNREWKRMEIDKSRARKRAAVGPKRLSGLLRGLSPELQEVLVSMKPDELTDLLRKVGIEQPVEQPV